MHVFLDCKLSFACFDWNTVLSAGYGCHISPARGTREFRFAICPVWQQATLVQGCTSEAQMNMDVNLCRLPDENSMMSKFLVPLAGFMWHPLLTDSAEILSKQAKRQFIIKKNEPLRTVVFHHRKINAYGILQNSFIQTLSPSAITCLSKRKGAFI